MLNRDYSKDAWHFVRTVDFSELDQLHADRNKETKLKILCQLNSAKARIKSFTASEFDADGPYADLLAPIANHLRRLCIDISMGQPDVLLLRLPRLCKLKLRLTRTAELSSSQLARFLQLPELEELSLEVSAELEFGDILTALESSALPSLQVLEISCIRLRNLYRIFSPLNHLKGVSSNLKRVSLIDKCFGENSFEMMASFFGLSESMLQLDNIHLLDAFTQSEVGISLGQWRFNEESIFSILACRAASRPEISLEKVGLAYSMCYSVDRALPTHAKWKKELWCRASEVLAFVDALSGLDESLLLDSTVSFCRTTIFELIQPIAFSSPSSSVCIGSNTIPNVVTKLVFAWCDFMRPRSVSLAIEERSLLEKCLDSDPTINPAALLLQNEALALSYFGDSIWSWERFSSPSWPEEIADMVATKLWKILLAREQQQEQFKIAAEAIRQSFPHLPHRIELFVTGRDRRETGPLECKLRVREARRLLSEVVAVGNKSH